MNIVQPSGPIENLFGSGLWIELAPVSDDANFDSFSKDINIDIVAKPTIAAGGTVSIMPKRTNSKHTVSFGIIDADGNEATKEIVLPDFRNSGELYAKLTGKKAKYKVIYDRCSFLRSKELYEHIAQVEHQIRNKYLAELGLDNLPQPARYQKSSPDHKIAQMDLFEMLSIELLAPASDEFFKNKIKGGMSPVEARRLTRLDEYRLPLSAEELNRFRDIRNSVMHFKVVTSDDAEFIAQAQSKMFKFQMMEFAYDALRSKKNNG